jgi:hypothetical protein
MRALLAHGLRAVLDRLVTPAGLEMRLLVGGV